MSEEQHVIPENLQQKVSWTQNIPNSPAKIRNIKVKEPTKKKKNRKPQKSETRYAYIINGCPKCNKKTVIMISEKALTALVYQIQIGYKPNIPEGMTRTKVRFTKEVEKDGNVRNSGKNET